jgi:DNA-binding IclR family transcriptional regulator
MAIFPMLSQAKRAASPGIQVIARAAAILRALKEQPAGLSLGQIATRVALPRSTVQRIVAALQNERLVMAAGPEGGIRLGPELQSLAEASRIDIVASLRPLLIELSLRTGETVDLAILRGDHLMFIDQIPGTQRLRAVSSVGDVFPLTTTANGKACLALLSDGDALALARAEWARQGLKPQETALLEHCAAIRKAGLAYDLDEHTEGISAVGTAFKGPQGALYAVSVPTPTARFLVDRQKLSEAMRVLASKVDALLNGA